MADLAQWIHAQLDADERIARAAAERVDPDWGEDDEHVYSLPHGYPVAFGSVGGMHGELRAHIAAHDPARVLREIDSRRQLLALHVITVEKADVAPFDSYTGERNPDEYNVTCAVCGWASDDRTSACLTLRLLALPYADREGYREEWRP